MNNLGRPELESRCLCSNDPLDDLEPVTGKSDQLLILESQFPEKD